jgi:hypothetical protein
MKRAKPTVRNYGRKLSLFLAIFTNKAGKGMELNPPNEIEEIAPFMLINNFQFLQGVFRPNRSLLQHHLLTSESGSQ